MEVALKLDWSNHQHVFQQVMHTSDHYYDTEINFCVLCNKAASQSRTPTNKHFEHPKGCKCFWCVYCECPELVERERQIACS